MRSLLIATTVLLISAHRLPAPIAEETPTPKPKVEAKTKTEGQGRAKSETASKPKESSFAQFAGVWTGSTNGRLVADNGLDSGPTSTVTTLRISSDGAIQTTSAVGTSQNYKGSLSSDGHALIWPMQYSESNGTARGQASLRLTGPKSGFYKVDVIMTINGAGKAIMNGSGTLTKQ